MGDITNSTTTKSLPADVEAAGIAGLKRAMEQFEKPYSAASTVDERFAQMPTAHARAYNTTLKNNGSQEPYFNAAGKRAEESQKFYPQEFGRYMNPAMEGIQGILNRQLQEQFKINKSNLDAQFAGRGVHGGPLYDQRFRELQNQHTQNLTDAHQKLLMDMYREGAQTFGAEKEHTLDLAKFLATLGQAHQSGKMQDILALLQVGDIKASDDEKRRQFEHLEREDQRNHEYEKINSLLSAVQGRPYTTTSRYTATQNHVTPSPRRNDYWQSMLPHAAAFVSNHLGRQGQPAAGVIPTPNFGGLRNLR